jgi:two-component system sensor histidine kinase ChvG
MLAIAAHRVRLGRSREVVVPRLPDRSDEIGALARAISDMSTALRRQIDATEAFAADVAHELKNPLASLRSAVEVLDRVEKPELRAQLLAVIRDDVGRIDRLITDIADASRLDAELSRTGFQPIDVAALADGLVAAYGIAATASNRSRTVSVERAGLAGPVLIEGDANRLAQVLRNLIDNAISFSPEGGRVTLALASRGDQVELAVSDQGPGVPAANRRDIFRRFYSERPEGEDFGRHSGLGLSIAGAIVVAHGGQIIVEDAPGGGAAFRVLLPAA